MSSKTDTPEVAAKNMAASEATQARGPEEFKSRIKPIWCPGCGNFGVLTALRRALAGLNIDPDNLALVSGIGCSSRLPGFVKCYAFHGVHGRALPVALGVKLGNPRLTVLIVGGDGDGLSIGAGHFPHLARRNVDVTYLMLDNRIYGLTKGQTSPTTLSGQWTKTSPQGVLEVPMSPVKLAITYGASFVARGYSARLDELQELVEKAVQHKGFSLVHVLSRCVTFGKGCGFDAFDTCVQPAPEDHDEADTYKALALVDDQEKIYTGVIYHADRPDFVGAMKEIGAARGRELGDDAPPIDIERLIRRFS